MASDTPHRPFTQPWADSFRIAINDDADYRAAAKGWQWPMALILDPSAALGYPEAVAVRLDLDEGVCREARIVAPAEADAAFTLRGPYAVWKRIVRGELDAIAAVVKQELELEGKLGILVKHAKSARALVNCARQVPTRFPDE
ncbi:MAG TPA: SCP2 sterol-binding domain-containing protein [Gemmatimonadaceae bacterium]|nr:SCP2 sterol-binding domain-containing protein [Gemmatimonadaceae bacterium]